MEIVSIKSKALKLLILKNDPRLLPAKYVPKIVDLINSLRDLDGIDEFLSLPKGKPHRLKGDRTGAYAISVYANWRLTFKYVAKDNTIHILDFEDYH